MRVFAQFLVWEFINALAQYLGFVSSFSLFIFFFFWFLLLSFFSQFVFRRQTPLLSGVQSENFNSVKFVCFFGFKTFLVLFLSL